VFVVDTNILIYAADLHAPEHKICRSKLLEWREQPSIWHLTWGIIYEFIRVSTHPKVFRNPFSLINARDFIQAILSSPSLNILTETQRHHQVMAEVFEQFPTMSGNLIFDAHTAILMKEHGIKTIYTHDTDFHRFPFLDVRDPVQSMK
jgi:uncharacterized protein